MSKKLPKIDCWFLLPPLPNGEARPPLHKKLEINNYVPETGEGFVSLRFEGQELAFVVYGGKPHVWAITHPTPIDVDGRPLPVDSKQMSYMLVDRRLMSAMNELRDTLYNRPLLTVYAPDFSGLRHVIDGIREWFKGRKETKENKDA